MDLHKDIPETVKEQFKLALKNIDLNLQEAGVSRKNITKLVLYFVDELDSKARGDILLDFFGDSLPCCTLIYVKALATPKIKVEIDAWAAQPV